MANSNKYSYSKIDMYNQCPLKFKLNYVDGMSCFVGNVATKVGTLVHETEETIAKKLIANEPIDYKALKADFIIQMAKIEHDYPEDWKTPDKNDKLYRDKLYNYLSTGIYKLEKFMRDNPNYEIVGTEIKFNFPYGDYTFNGSIDRMFKDKVTGRYLIQDIKTWAEEASKDDLATPLQFVIYAMAASKMYDIDIETIDCQYYLPFLDGMIQDGGTKGYIGRGKKKLDSLFDGILSENWKPAQGPLCHWCNYSATNKNAPAWAKYLCPYFCHWTRDNKTFENENTYDENVPYKTLLEQYHKQYGLKVPPKPEQKK